MSENSELCLTLPELGIAQETRDDYIGIAEDMLMLPISYGTPNRDSIHLGAYLQTEARSIISKSGPCDQRDNLKSLYRDTEQHVRLALECGVPIPNLIKIVREAKLAAIEPDSETLEYRAAVATQQAIGGIASQGHNEDQGALTLTPSLLPA